MGATGGFFVCAAGRGGTEAGTNVKQKAGPNRAILAKGRHGFKVACQNAARRTGSRIDPEYCHRTLEIDRRRLERWETRISTLSGHRDRHVARMGDRAG
ncbi:hypothetical protein ACFXKD_04320 [Nocardiopsis aegyptia]|uniref:hypothetical protein n=1 Tax=Nocardiopsis aegyptia TaxID=220378 RepID=UPI0036731243